MHPRTKAKTKEITKTILDLVAHGFMTYAAFGSPKALGKYGKILENFGDYGVWRIRKTLKRLKMQNMIQYEEDDLKSPIMLTEKGLARLVRDRLRDIFKKNKKWDYFWRLVFFDIPEEKRCLRDHLRRELVAAGFYPFQKSVFVCPFDCENAVLDFCKTCKISENVLFCVTPSLGRKEKQVRQFFFSQAKLRRSLK